MITRFKFILWKLFLFQDTSYRFTFAKHTATTELAHKWRYKTSSCNYELTLPCTPSLERGFGRHRPIGSKFPPMPLLIKNRIWGHGSKNGFGSPTTCRHLTNSGCLQTNVSWTSPNAWSTPHPRRPPWPSLSPPTATGPPEMPPKPCCLTEQPRRPSTRLTVGPTPQGVGHGPPPRSWPCLPTTRWCARPPSWPGSSPT